MRRMILTLSTIGAALLVLAAAKPAGAQTKLDLGEKGQFILSADRLMPLFSYQSVKTGDDDSSAGSRKNSTGGFSFLTSNLGHQTVFDAPRVALDYAIINNLTIGGSVFVAFDVSNDLTTKVNGQSTSVDQAKGTYWGFAPRVGYVIPLTRAVAFWPRGGISYISGKSQYPSSNDNDSSVKQDQFALDLEPVFVLSPAQHFGITVGPVFDIPISGTYKTEIKNNNNTVTTSIDSTQFYFGLTAGLLGYF